MRRDRWKPKRSETPKRISLLHRAWSGVKWIGSIPGRAFPKHEVADGGRVLSGLLTEVRRGVRGDARFRVDEDRHFDLEATAFLHGMKVWQVENLMQRRRRQTALSAYIFFGAGWALFAYWLFEIAITPWASWSIAPVLEFAPFCLFLFLTAFQIALQNYQLRTRRLATAWEYLTTSEQFWPS
ncbi:hypothetical protein FM996_20300 [Methylosinus sporium]|uniref:Uncharacterized protein n=1 Tax=Methylosinus sporium TaxID=428 RepID=A0A549SD58_METSR|nr:hypothetical protein [Methylosinus sporium]TRL24699.1 hypothetical protein FM996_20300 [Methylosinus sporium]